MHLSYLGVLLGKGVQSEKKKCHHAELKDNGEKQISQQV